MLLRLVPAACAGALPVAGAAVRGSAPAADGAGFPLAAGAVVRGPVRVAGGVLLRLVPVACAGLLLVVGLGLRRLVAVCVELLPVVCAGLVPVAVRALARSACVGSVRSAAGEVFPVDVDAAVRVTPAAAVGGGFAQFVAVSAGSLLVACASVLPADGEFPFAAGVIVRPSSSHSFLAVLEGCQV